MTLGGPNPISTPTTAANTPVQPADKRAALQMALLQKSLEAQNREVVEISNAAEGKGRLIDLRV